MGKRSGIMLAYPLEERRLLLPKFGWKFPVIVQPKLDGERCHTKGPSGRDPILLTSEMNIFESVPHINEALRELNLPFEPDGELYCHGKSFSEIHSICSRSAENIHPDAHEMQFHIFDIADDPNIQLKRSVRLSEIDLPRPLVLVPIRICYSLEEVLAVYQGYLNAGYEGIIVRHVNLLYTRKRSPWMMKFKPKKRDRYKITGVYEAIDKNGNPKNMVGGFNCVDEEGNEFDIGAGMLTHDRRYAIWEYREDFVGGIADVQYQHLTDRGVPRFGLAVDVEGDF